MQIAGMILGCLLVGQAPDAVLLAPAEREKGAPAVLEPIMRSGSGGNEAPGKSTRSRLRPPEMVADAMQLPKGSTLTGQPLTLLSVLELTPDRRQQLELTRAYWDLAQAAAEYHFCLDHAQDLERIKPTDNEPASLRLARASAAAMLRQAELEATGAQCELARLARLPAGSPLPLPADRPHVGPYRTNFQEMFAGRTPPEPAVLMERILPIRRQAVDDQAAAVQAAEDVLAAVADQQQSGQGDAAGATACGRELLRQQRVFIRAVCAYNRYIAEYGLAVAGPTANAQLLAAILIGPVQQGVAPVISGDVQPAGASEPIGNPMGQPSRNEPTLAPPRTNSESTPAPSGGVWRTTEPTLAPPRDGVKKSEPTLAPPRDGLRPVEKNEPTLAPPRDGLRPVEKNEPTLAPPRDEEAADQAPAAIQQKPLVPIETLPSSPSPRPRTARKPALADAQLPFTSGEGRGTRGEGAVVAAASPLYPALVDAAPAVRAKQLTVALHWDRSLPEGIGKPMSLADCLLRDAGADRRATIEAYWRLRQRAAEYQVHVQQVELLEGLVSVVLERRSEPLGAAEMLRLHSAQLAARASMREAHAALVEAQYALALRLGATGESAWPLASTVPHSGSYLLKLDAQPRAVVESWPVRRLAAVIPALGESVRQHAAAVVEADAARVAAAEQYRAGGAPIEQAIESIAEQTRQTMAALDTLTAYNRAIAEYVLTVLPPATPANRLVAALVVKP